MTAVQHGTFAFDFIPATFVLPAEYSLMQVCAIPSAMLGVVWYPCHVVVCTGEIRRRLPCASGVPKSSTDGCPPSLWASLIAEADKA